jgi:hypothetical protein
MPSGYRCRSPSFVEDQRVAASPALFGPWVQPLARYGRPYGVGVQIQGLRLAIVVAAIGVLGSAGVAGAGTHNADPTVKVIAPVLAGRIAPGYTASSQRSGYCQSPDRGQGINLSYRCFSGNRIYETCLAAPAIGRGVVACINSPWSHHLQLLRTRQRFRPSAQPVPTGGVPWGIRLSNGVRCTNLIDVMHGYFHHRWINYSCGNGNVGVAGILGGLDRTTSPWTVQVVVIPRGGPHRGCPELPSGPPRCTRVRRVGVSTAVFAQDLPSEATSLPFTGPPLSVYPSTTVGVALVLLGLLAVRLSRVRSDRR